MLSEKQKLGECTSMRNAPQDMPQGKGVLEIQGNCLKWEPGCVGRNEGPHSWALVPPASTAEVSPPGLTSSIRAGPGEGPLGMSTSSWNSRPGAGAPAPSVTMANPSKFSLQS